MLGAPERDNPENLYASQLTSVPAAGHAQEVLPLLSTYPEGPPGRARGLYSLLLSTTMYSTADSLKGVEAYIFDVFGPSHLYV